MRICDTRDHGEIVFEGRDCEACETIRDLKEQIRELEDAGKALNGQINDLIAELEEAQHG